MGSQRGQASSPALQRCWGVVYTTGQSLSPMAQPPGIGLRGTQARLSYAHHLQHSSSVVVSPTTADHLSLSQLDHGEPKVQAHPEVVQSTAAFPHEIVDALLPRTASVFHNT